MEVLQQSAVSVKKPVVSVVTVVFNDRENIERTILSVLDQTYKDFEYIIIDGGSTDGTVDVIKKYKDKITFFLSEKDQGIYDAMNKSLQYVKGEWVQFLNSGDYFFNNSVLTELFFQSDYAGVDLVYGNFIGNFNNRAVLCLAPSTVVGIFWKGMPICHNALFVRAALMKQFKFNRQFKVSADTDFITHCASAGYKFQYRNVTVFRVGTLGYSNANWLTARLENWRIARFYFPGFKTDAFHGQALVREVLFRLLKRVTSWFGLYQLARFFYRKVIQKKFHLLPKNISPFQD